MERREGRSEWWLAGLALAALALVLLTTALSGKGARTAPATGHVRRDARLVFDLALMDGRGVLLAHPRLLGRAGEPLLATYRQAGSEGLAMRLDPLLARDDLDLRVDLALPGQAPRSGRLRLPLAERRLLRLPGEGGDVLLAVRVLAEGTPAFDAWVRRVRRARPARVPAA